MTHLIYHYIKLLKYILIKKWLFQASKQVNIPKEHHRWILGKLGQKLKDLEKATATKISVPSIADNSEILTITGTKEGIEKAEHEIRICSEEQVRYNIKHMFCRDLQSWCPLDSALKP